MLITVIVHELAHFFMARKYGINAQEIGIGLPFPGKRNFSYVKEIRGIRVSINPIPLGAFVDIGPNQINKLDSAFKKIMIYLAGSLVNVIVGTISAFVLFMIKGAGILKAITLSLSFTAYAIVSIPAAILNVEFSSPIGLVNSIANSDGAMQIPALMMLLSLIAAANISIGLLNIMLAFPPLDGGYIVFTILEKVFGNNRIENIRNKTTLAGVIIIISLTIFSILKDLGLI